MSYQYANNAASTLVSPIATAVRPVSFDVVDASSFPMHGDFDVIIDDEILLITNVSGNTLTGSNSEGTTATTHASAAPVTQILTRLGLLLNPGPTTDVGDMQYFGASDLPTRLPIGTPDQVLTANGDGHPEWADAPDPFPVNLATEVSGILPTANGGTGIAYFTAAGPTAARVFTFPNAAATIARTDAGQTFTGAQVITEPVGASGLIVTGATQVSSFPALSVTQTWNASGTTFTAVKVNVTATASAVGSLLMDLQVGASSKVTINKSGKIIIYTAGTANDFIDIGGSVNQQINFGSNNLGISCRFQGDTTGSGGPAQFAFGAQGLLSWQSTNRADAGSQDTGLSRISAGLVGVGTGAQGSSAGTIKATVQVSANATTGLVAGVLAASTNASIVITDGSGQVYRVPCII